MHHLIVTGERPAIAASDQDAWVARFGAVDGDPAAWLSLHRRLRARPLALLAGLAAVDRDLVGIHEERGEESVRGLVEHVVHHDEEHLAQMQALVGAAV